MSGLQPSLVLVPVPVLVPVLVLVLLVPQSHAASREADPPQYQVVHPTRVDARGHFLSHFLSHHARRVQRRAAAAAEPDRVFYRLSLSGRSLRLNLTSNPGLLAPGFLTERRSGGLRGARIHTPASSTCHFLGEVWDEDTARGGAAISACDGLTGLFQLWDEDFFIQPLETPSGVESAPQAHAIFKRHATPPPFRAVPAFNRTCGVRKWRGEEAEQQRQRWERRQQRRRRRVGPRSVSREKWVETLVVADPKMVEHHGGNAVESYVLTVMNIVAGLFRDPSIGNAINVVIVRLILLEEDEDDLKITHHADNSLNSFCRWQKKLNMKGDEHPLHHDVAVLLTRKDICTSINLPCETLGLSHVSGMCQPHRSCSISEDTGLPLAFTVAHEMGHNFGIQHDGNGNDCEPVGKRPFVMSPQLLYGTALPRWSRCSRQYITRFLDRGWGSCLDDPPVKDRLSSSSVPPGVLYNAVHQCRLQYGAASRLCNQMEDVCSTLWCTVGTTCHSKLDGAADGTSCGPDKWCLGGECVAAGFHPDSVHGGWGAWSRWSACSRTCGAGVSSAHRDCDSPVPTFRGRYCLGERRRYRICNTAACGHDSPSFRDLQCSHFNSLPYKGKLFQWEAVINRVNPCELHCRPLNQHFSEKMRDAVADGTPCYHGNKSRDMCINGICQKVGCDFVVDSSAVEDRCGVCQGNGSTCSTIRKSFHNRHGLGYMDIGLIPAGAWDIRIEEVAEAGNFLALRGDEPGRYFLNGGWTIQWSGEYKAAGAIFSYQRTGHLENLTSPGPTVEPLWIQLLFQETNPGVRYEFTISQNISQDHVRPLFSWKLGSWTECSVTCGTGVQTQTVHCVEKTTGIAEQHLCDPAARPETNQSSCSKAFCPAVWSVGEWQTCSSSCGASGRTERSVRCVRAVSAEEQRVLDPSDCLHIPKPPFQSSCNTHVPCPSDWTTGGWSKCSVSCGGGVRQRNVSCSRNTGVDCDPLTKPPATAACRLHDCPPHTDDFGGGDWSGSGWSDKELPNEIERVTPVKSRGPARVRGEPNHLLEDSQENSVEVDDFYYDYNFINFHEDLSDDLEDDRPPESGPSLGDVRSTSAPTSPSVPKAQNQRHSHAEAGESDGASDDQLDFLAEDHLLPVVTTRSPLRSKHLQDPEGVGTEPRLGSTPGPPAQDVEADWSEEAEETLTEAVTMTTVLTTTTVFTTMTIVTTTTEESHQTEARDVQEDKESLQYFDSPTLESESPATLSTAAPAVTQDDHFSTSGADRRATPAPGSEQLSPLPSVLFSSTGQASDSPASTFGTEIRPPTDLEGVRNLSADVFQMIPVKTTSPANAKTSRPFSTSGPASNHSSDFDDSEIVPPPLPTISHSGYRFSTWSQHSEPPTSAEPIFPTPSTETPADPSNSSATHWMAGNWSACSTSCGLGATWRPLACSTGLDSDCDSAERPAPARRCYLRPCSTWKVGGWSKCSKDCDGGVKLRDVQCFDLRDQRALRPFHCRAVESRPPTLMPCGLEPCIQWFTSSWGQCSEVCGGGEQQRIVACPEENRCDRNLQPSNIQPCNVQPCAQWLTGSWGPCSAPCGGGLQHRLIQCVDAKAETDGEVDADRCRGQTMPHGTRKCNLQECQSAPSGAVCVRDLLTSAFCHTLHWLGRCRLPNVSHQCCRTCRTRKPPKSPDGPRMVKPRVLERRTRHSTVAP